MGRLQEAWAGGSVFYLSDSIESAQLDAVAIGKEKNLTKDLVFRNIVESNLVGNLIWEELSAEVGDGGKARREYRS